MQGATVKPPGEKLNPWWKVSCRARTVPTRLIPPIEDFTIFEESSHEPLVIFGTIAFPSYEELIASATRARVENPIDFVFLESIWCKHWSGPRMFSGRE
jgi:hypothetical protein